MQHIISLDQQLLLLLNFDGPPWLDNVMWGLSQTLTWLPLLLALVYTTARAYSLRNFALFLLFFIVTIALADQASAHLIKPLCQRLRPTHEPAIMAMVHTVRGYTGGMYGFVSSHAANMFATSTLIVLSLRGTGLAIALYAKDALVAYSRIYLGVHSPGAVLSGALLRLHTGLITYQLLALLVSPRPPRPRLQGLRPCPCLAVARTRVIFIALLLTLVLVFTAWL